MGRPTYSSDLYALGLTVIYMLTGRLPQEIDTDFTTGEILWSKHCPIVSPTLIGVIKKAIAVNAADRFVTASAMQEALIQGNMPSVASSRTKATVVVSPQANFQSPKNYSESYTNIWLQTLVISGSIATAIVLGFWMLSRSNSTIKTTHEEKLIYPTINPQETSSSFTGETQTNLTPSILTPTPISPTPTPIVTPNPTLIPSIVPSDSYIEEGSAIVLIETLYFLISEEEFGRAIDLLNLQSNQLAEKFDPDFFSQFTRVTVSDLYVTSRTSTSINLEGINTYVWADGSIQRELRTYTVRQIGNELKITDSEFVRVVQSR